MAFHDLDQLTQAYRLPNQQQATEMPFPGGAGMWQGGQGAMLPQPYMGSPVQGGMGPHPQGQGQGQGMGGGQGQGGGMMQGGIGQSPFGGQALGGTQVPQLNAANPFNDPSQFRMQGVQGLPEPLPPIDNTFRNMGMTAGLGAQAPQLQSMGMGGLKNMSQQRPQPQMMQQPGSGYGRQRGLLG